MMNDYESHLTYEFWEYVKTNNILMFKLFSHSIHLTQLLNVEVFQSMKHWHSKAVDTVIRLSNVEFSRLNFLTAFRDFKTKAFKLIIVQSAWKKIDLISYNSEVVLSKIRVMNLASTFDFTRYIFWSSLISSDS